MNEIHRITGSGIPLLLDDIDTDRIVPARYLRCVTFEGLGEHAFEDDRAHDADHPFDDPRFAAGSVLITGRNFGCGSSREHAPQALIRRGIKAIVAESFAEIFFGNCISLGVPAVTAGRPEVEKLAGIVRRQPDAELTLDLDAMELRAGGLTIPVEMPDSARTALTSGRWDYLSQLQEAREQIRETAERLPYVAGFA